MAFATFAVEELAEDLKIEQSVIAYTELHMGQLRHRRYMQAVERVRMGLQVSPENFFYNAGQWTGAPYVNLNALEFTALAGTAEDLAYGAASIATPVELISIVGGEEDPDNPGTILAGSETCKLKLAVNADLIEQIEVRDGDTYTVCDAVGSPVSTTTQVIHLSLKSTNKPDFTFYQWHPQSKYKFNRECNLCTDALDPTLAAAYMGDNNYVLSAGAFEALKTAVDGIS
jgi:hypothetical protein